MTAENIQPALREGKADAATIYALSERIKRDIVRWVKFIGVDEINRRSRFRKPRNTNHAEEMMVNHVDRIKKLPKLEKISELIEEDKMFHAWNEILG